MVIRVKTTNNLATFICPECIKSRTVDVSRYKNSDIPVQVNCKCRCGHIFSVYLERRKDPRREIVLPGVYLCYMGNNEIFRESMFVMDISLSGLKFGIHEMRKIVKGEKYWVRFNLNDADKTLIKKEVTIRHIDDFSIGAEFCSAEKDKRLEAYLNTFETNNVR